MYIYTIYTSLIQNKSPQLWWGQCMLLFQVSGILDFYTGFFYIEVHLNCNIWILIRAEPNIWLPTFSIISCMTFLLSSSEKSVCSVWIFVTKSRGSGNRKGTSWYFSSPSLVGWCPDWGINLFPMEKEVQRSSKYIRQKKLILSW